MHLQWGACTHSLLPKIACNSMASCGLQARATEACAIHPHLSHNTQLCSSAPPPLIKQLVHMSPLVRSGARMTRQPQRRWAIGCRGVTQSHCSHMRVLHPFVEQAHPRERQAVGAPLPCSLMPRGLANAGREDHTPAEACTTPLHMQAAPWERSAHYSHKRTM